MELYLDPRHQQEAHLHEAALIALLLLDRKLVRLATVQLDAIADPTFRTIYRRLRQDWCTPLKQLLDRTEPATARVLAEAIVDHHSGRLRVFWWNFDWHQAEIERYAELRERFRQAKDFVLEYCAL